MQISSQERNAVSDCPPSILNRGLIEFSKHISGFFIYPKMNFEFSQIVVINV